MGRNSCATGVAAHLGTPWSTLLPLTIAVLVALRFCCGATTSWMKRYVAPASSSYRQIASSLFLIAYGVMLVMAGQAKDWMSFLQWLGLLSFTATMQPF